MDQSLREVVRRRAGNAGEYCRVPQEATRLISFHVEHIVSRQHRGNDDPAGLALACDRCNAYKGPNISSVDPEIGSVTALFHPRNDLWSEHFRDPRRASRWTNSDWPRNATLAQYE